MSDSTRAGLPPTPELATDAELSGLFRIIEDSRAADGEALPLDGGQRAAVVAVCGARPFSADTSRAFARLARVVAAELNR